VTAHVATSVTLWRHARAIALLPFMNTVVIPVLLLTLFPPHLPATWHAASVLVAVAGTAALASGATLVTHSIRLFMRLGRGTLAPWDPTRELVSVGAYRFTRNPMKAGLFLVLAGEGLLARSPALAAWLVCFAIVNVVYIRVHEEPGLRWRFGQRYRDYCALVPRWWPSLPALLTTAVAKEPTR
jgi:protein-S-isoprenylcysteine O-methyltransferase Ste14